LGVDSDVTPSEQDRFGDAINTIDDALTNFLGNFSTNPEGKKKSELVVEAAMDAKNKVLFSLSFPLRCFSTPYSLF